MELRDYIHVIRARKWVIIQAVVIVTLAAAIVSLVLPKSYEGTAEVLITQNDSASAILGQVAPLSAQPDRDLQTQVQLMAIRPIVEATIKQLDLQTTPEILTKQIDIGGVGQTNIVKITATSSDPQTAEKIANAMASQYVQASQAAQRENIAAAANEVQLRLDQARAEIIDVGHRLAASGKSTDLQAELQIATSTYSTLAEKLEQLRINEQLETGSGRVVSQAVVDPQAISPRVARNTGLGAFVGLLFGLAMAFVFEYLDNTIKSTEEVEKYFGASVLGTIPLDKMDKVQKRRLAIVEAPGSAAAEAYRVLRNSLDFVNFQNDIKTILVTSAAPGEGKSTVSSNLAAALAQAGKKVVLVSVDFRRPTTDQFFNTNNLVGLSDVLLGTHSLKAALQRPGDDQLLVLTSGKMPPNPSELLSSEKMQDVLRSLGEWGEWVIIDAPPLLAVADPASVARWADGVLMVSQAGVTTRDAAKKAVELLDKVGARVVGVVVWGLDESGTGSVGYGHYTGGYYYYASYYGQSGGAGEKGRRDGGDAKSEGWVPEQSFGKRLAIAVGRLLTGVLAFILVVAIAAIVAYFLDAYFGWGLARTVSGMLHL